jgi:hypothetical protein
MPTTVPAITPPPSPTATLPSISTDSDVRAALGKSLRHHSRLLRNLGWRHFIHRLQQPTDYADNLANIPHSAGTYLHRLVKCGVPAPSASPPWSSTYLKATLRRGPHSSATGQYRTFLHRDLLDMINKGYWAILPFRAVKAFPHLKLSPAGVDPQRTRRPHPIMDYSFTGVNQASLPLSPLPSMQFGHALPRLLQRIAYANPSHGPLLLLKLDLVDGYYRICLSPEAALELALVLPGLVPHSPLGGIPLCIPMGWTHSPPYFCSFKETATDLANLALSSSHPDMAPPHLLEIPSQLHDVPQEPCFHDNILQPPTISHTLPPLSYVDVFIDNFIGLVQPPTAPGTLRRLLHSIDAIFRAHVKPDDKASCKQIISATKLEVGDGAWSTEKVILGWLLNTALGTLALPKHKADRLQLLLHHFATLHCTSRTKWCSLLGELCHMSVALQGARYLFSVLQSVLSQQPTASRLCLSPFVHASLADWSILANTVTTYPVPITSLVSRAPHYVGAVDASKQGLGGFWLPTKFGKSPPSVFRVPFGEASLRLLTSDNPNGDLTINNLELAAFCMGACLLPQTTLLSYDSLWLGSDNASAVSCTTRGSISSTGPNAHLL